MTRVSVGVACLLRGAVTVCRWYREQRIERVAAGQVAGVEAFDGRAELQFHGGHSVERCAPETSEVYAIGRLDQVKKR